MCPVNASAGFGRRVRTSATSLPCPCLRTAVVLASERRAHVVRRHPELGDAHARWIAETLGRPDEVRKGRSRPNARVLSRWHPARGKHMAAVVAADWTPIPRHWIATAQLARKLVLGVTEWRRG
jgi:hypothetical protein